MLNQTRRFVVRAISLGFLTALLVQAVPFAVYAGSLLGVRSDQISSSNAGATVTHRFTIRMLDTSTPIGSIGFEFCSNSPIPNTACAVPIGLDVSAANLSTQSGDTGFSLHANTTANRIVITRPAANPGGVTSTYQFDNVVNPTNGGSYYVRLQTYTADDGTGSDIENGGVVFSIDKLLDVNAEVPPYLRFCASVTIVSFDCSTATSFFIDLGELSTTASTKASSQFVVATNAASGYSVTLSGTTLTSGNNIIPGMASQAGPSVGSSEFGINLKANSNPSIGAEVVGPGTSVPSPSYGAADQYKFQNGDTLTSVNHSDANRKYTISYVTNISNSQPPGVYATTITYICLANF